MDVAVLPVKSPGRAKSRLAPLLAPAERRRLAEALYLDALELCARVRWLRWWVVSDDPGVLSEAAARGMRALRDPGVGLNPALELAAAAARAEGAASLTVLASDLPLASPSDLEQLRDTAETSDVVLAPSLGDGGTNALVTSPPGVIAYRFGPGSLEAHTRAADERGLRLTVVVLPGLGHDLDTPADAAALAGDENLGGATAAVLRALAPRLTEARADRRP